MLEHLAVIVGIPPDPRVNGWPFMDSSYWTLGICAIYLLFIKVWGPNYMKHRKPFDLKNTILIFNFVQIWINVYLIYEGVAVSIHENYKWYCEEIDFSNDERAVRMLKNIYFYYLMKLVELLDTVFFVLRKKNNQITVLHMFHHMLMPINMWSVTKYVGGGQYNFMIPLNALIHVVMYTYYFLAALGPGVQKYLWWKKYLTLLQIIQLIGGIIKLSAGIYVRCKSPVIPIFMAISFGVLQAQFILGLTKFITGIIVGCNVPLVASLLAIGNGIVQLTLFTNFYIQSYTKKHKIN